MSAAFSTTAVKRFVNRSDISQIRKIVADARARGTSSAPYQTMRAAAILLAECIEAMRRAGINFDRYGSTIHTPAEVGYEFSMCDMERSIAVVQSLVLVMHAARLATERQHPGYMQKFVIEEVEPAAPSQPEPAAVRVVEMPARSTITEIVRDKAGAIVGSSQHESDVRHDA